MKQNIQNLFQGDIIKNILPKKYIYSFLKGYKFIDSFHLKKSPKILMKAREEQFREKKNQVLIKASITLKKEKQMWKSIQNSQITKIEKKSRNFQQDQGILADFKEITIENDLKTIFLNARNLNAKYSKEWQMIYLREFEKIKRRNQKSKNDGDLQ